MANSAPPTNWQTNGYNDAAWPNPVGNPGYLPLIWPERPDLDLTEQALFRAHFTIPLGTVMASAQALIDGDCKLLAVYLNGVSLPFTLGIDMNTPQTVSFSPALFLLGADNVFAVWAEASATALTPSLADVQYIVSYST